MFGRIFKHTLQYGHAQGGNGGGSSAPYVPHNCNGTIWGHKLEIRLEKSLALLGKKKLRALCLELNLPVKGNKKEMRARILLVFQSDKL